MRSYNPAIVRRTVAGVGLILTAFAVAGAPAGAFSGDSFRRSGPSAGDQGKLRADVQRDPWRLSFRDSRGRAVLSEFRATGLGPSGTLGFRTPAGWFHATKVIDDRRTRSAYLATLATTDPARRRLQVRITRGARGVIELNAAVTGATADVTAVGIGFEARGAERYLGFGERSNAVDQRGNTVENYVAEGPYQREERPFVAAFVPPQGFRARDDATYFPMPWLLSTRGYGVLVDNLETSYFRLGTDRSEAWSLEAEANQLSMRVFAGPRPPDVLGRLTKRIGRQPRPAAPWYFGPWYQPWEDDEADGGGDGREGAELRQAERLRAADAPASVAQTYTHYLPCGDQRGNRAAERSRTRGFHRAGFAVTTYFNPMICTDYQPVFGEAERRGLLTKDPLGQPVRYRYSTSSQFLVSQFDFSAKGTDDFFGGLLGEAVRNGYDGWMEDFGEYTPIESRSANGMSGRQMHNRYPVLYHRSGYRFTKRSSRPLGNFIRSGFTGVHPYARIVWGGDPTSSFGFDGLESAVRNGLTMGLSGISVWGSDIGGFFQLGRNRLTPELLVRWIEFGAVSGVMRTQAEGIAIPQKSRPQILDPDILPHWRRYAKLRTQLYPYIAAANAEYRRSGLPIMRHLALTHPGDHRARAADDEFMFGPDLLAAPVVEPGARSRRVYLPRGEWVDLWRSVKYRERDGDVRLRRARDLPGRGSTRLDAPLGELPLLARAGAVVPMLPDSVESLTDYGGKGGPVTLRDRRHRLDLLAFPRGRSSSPLAGGGKITSIERRGRWKLEIKSAERRHRYDLQASTTTLERPFRPCRVTLDGRALPKRAWRFDREQGKLLVRFAARSARLVASERCSG